MNTNIVDFFQYKKKFDTQIICIGDTVEWQDFTGELLQAVVKSISYIPFEGEPMTNPPKEFPLWEKHDYTVEFSHGLTVTGSTIIRKVIKRKEHDKSKIINPHTSRNMYV